MKRSGIRRRTGLKRGTKGLRQFGKKGKQWNSTRRKLNRQRVADENIYCEVRLPGCTYSTQITHAHLKKRRHLGEGELEITINACLHCHNRVELRGEAIMHRFFSRIHNRRERMLLEQVVISV